MRFIAAMQVITLEIDPVKYPDGLLEVVNFYYPRDIICRGGGCSVAKIGTSLRKVKRANTNVAVKCFLRADCTMPVLQLQCRMVT